MMTPEFVKLSPSSYKQGSGICSFKQQKSSDSSRIGFLKRIRDKFARVFPFASTNIRRSAARVSSLTFERSRSYAYTPDDSHRAEAISDCIQFLNASSSLHRSNSVLNASSSLHRSNSMVTISY